MTLPATLNKAKPPDTGESPALGANYLRTIATWFEDLFGIPDVTPISGPIITLAATNDGRVATDTVVKASRPVKRLIGTEASGKDVQFIEDTGVVKLQRNDGAEGAPVWTTVWQVDTALGPQNGDFLTNRTGVTLAVGNAVTLSSANDSSVVTGDTTASLQAYLFALDAPANLALGRFVRAGSAVTVSTTGVVTRGHYLQKSATAYVLEDSGIAMAAGTNAPPGALGVAETASAGGLSTVLALLFGFTAQPTVAVGTVSLFGGSAAPSGWLLCDGSVVSRTTYAALRAVIGSTYGDGDGVTTFNLPDGRGRMAVGAGQGSGLTNRALAATGGEETHILTAAELAAHTHTLANHTHGAANGGTFVEDTGSGGFGLPAGSVIVTGNGATAGPSTNTSGSAGSGSGHNTMPPFLSLSMIIKF